MKIDYKTAYENVMIANKMLENENMKLNNKIDKAIHYIENDMPYLEQPDDFYEDNHKMVEYDTTELLEILKGNNK